MTAPPRHAHPLAKRKTKATAALQTEHTWVCVMWRRRAAAAPLTTTAACTVGRSRDLIASLMTCRTCASCAATTREQCPRHTRCATRQPRSRARSLMTPHCTHDTGDECNTRRRQASKERSGSAMRMARSVTSAPLGYGEALLCTAPWFDRTCSPSKWGSPLTDRTAAGQRYTQIK